MHPYETISARYVIVVDFVLEICHRFSVGEESSFGFWVTVQHQIECQETREAAKKMLGLAVDCGTANTPARFKGRSRLDGY